MKITKIILLTIIFSLFTLQASAISFTNLSVGGTGSVNAGNGYFDDDASQFNYTGSRNVYTISEDTQIHILEPISYASGASGAIQVINSSFGTIKDSVVHNGYLYFVDGTTLKKKSTRSNTGTCESNATSPGECITTISTGVGESLRVYNGVLYFTTGTTGFKHLDASDNVVNDFAICAPFGGDTQRTGGYTVTENNSVVQVYALCGGSPITLRYFTSSGGTTISTGELGNAAEYWYSFYTTTNYVYMLGTKAGGTNNFEQLARISNSTRSTIDYVTDNSLQQNNRVYVSSETTIGLMVSSATTYETFNSNEAGVSSLPTFPVELTYDLVELSSVQTSYYNNTNIQIVQAIQLTFADNPILWVDVDNNYRWRVDLIDPQNIAILSFTTGACNGLLTCSVTNVITFQPPDTNWTSGTYKARLYELNIVTGTSALLETSDTFTVLNTSSGGGSVAPGTGGGGGTGGGVANTQTALNLISVFSLTAFWGFVIWLGIVGSIIITMSQNPSGVNGIAVIVVAWLSAIMIALVGLFDPFKIYIIVMSTIIAAVLFKYGKSATTEG